MHNVVRRPHRTSAVALLALLVGLLVGGPVPAANADWSGSTNLATGGQRIIGTPQIGYDGSGRAYAVWTDYRYPSDDRVWLRERPAGGPWEAPQLLPTTGTGYVRSLDLAVDAAGDVVVTWYGNGITAMRRPAAGTWGPQKTWSSPGTAGPGSGCPNEPFASIGDDGTTLIGWTSYQSCNGNVSRWRVMTGTWTSAGGWQATPTVLSISAADVHSSPAVSVGSGGALLMAVGARNASGVDEMWTVEGTAAGGWNAPVKRATNAGNVPRPSVAQRGGTAVVSWFSNSGAQALVRSAGSWTGAQYLPVSGAQQGQTPPSVAVDGSGRAYVALNALSGGGWVSHLETWTSGGFTDSVISALSSVDPQISVNAAGDLGAVWEQLAGGGATAYTALRPADGDWGDPQQVSVVPSVNGARSQPQVAVDVWGHALALATPSSAGFGTELDVVLESRDPATEPDSPVTISPGTAVAGDTLTCDAGGFGGTPPFRYTYQWSLEGGAVAGATASSYVVQRSDAGQGLSCTVSAGNEAGSATSVSDTLVVGSTPPAFTSATTVTGTVQAGSTLTCAPGALTGAPDPDVTFQWLRNGQSVPGETTSTYDVPVSDGGNALSCRATATNDAGSAVSAAVAVTVPVAVGPRNKTLPTISGPAPAGTGSQLTCGTGTWAGSPTPTYAFFWLRDGVQIPDGYGAGYTVVAADAGATITCQVSATNPAGDVTVTSKNTRVVQPSPVNTSLPVVRAATGSTWSVGGTGQCTSGAWRYATSFGYQWLRNGNPIAGQTQATHVLVPADAGTSLSCAVTATGISGSAGAVTATRAVPAAPAVVTAPTVTGVPRPGKILTCNRGTWSGAASFAFAWQRGGTQIAGATTNKLTLAAGDVGTSITCTVTAQGSGGSSAATTTAVTVTR